MRITVTVIVVTVGWPLQEEKKKPPMFSLCLSPFPRREAQVPGRPDLVDSFRQSLRMPRLC